jgi:hypothetical protein
MAYLLLTNPRSAPFSRAHGQASKRDRTRLIGALEHGSARADNVRLDRVGRR